MSSHAAGPTIHLIVEGFILGATLESSSKFDVPLVVATGGFPDRGGLISQLAIPVVEEPAANAFALVEVASQLELRPPGEWHRKGIRAEFPPDPDSGSRGGRSPLKRAFGKNIESVLDLTAGLGSDAFRLAEAGYRVEGCERNPAVYALLDSGWRNCVSRGRVSGAIAQRVSFRFGDARDLLNERQGASLGAYLDPMYPVRRKGSALPKRPIQILRDLLRGDEEPTELVATARKRLSRVVVKRPHYAPPLVDRADFAVETKLVRFDVYLNPARMGVDEK